MLFDTTRQDLRIHNNNNRKQDNKENVEKCIDGGKERVENHFVA